LRVSTYESPGDVLVDPLYVALSRQHPLAWREQIALADLADEAWLIGNHAQHLARRAREAGFVPRQNHSVLDYAAAQAFVAANLGIAVMPGLASMSNRHPGIVCRRLLPAMSRTVHIVTLNAAAQMPALQAMMTALDQAVARLGTS
jgi:DNA-binding transcriptional LysR family regulator